MIPVRRKERLRSALVNSVLLLGALLCAPRIAAAAPAPGAPPVAATPAPAPAASTPPLEVPEQSLRQPPPPAATPLPFRAFSVAAKSMAWYSNRYILTGDGNVDIHMDGGVRVTGNTFFMDVRLNRFVIAGNVKLYALGREFQGAAFSDYLDFNRQYFVPSLGAPDRWTFTDADFNHPLFGRAMPGDTFFLPDVSHDSPLVLSTRVVVQPRESLLFSRPSIKLGLVYVPFPSYFLTFGPNPNLAQNSLPGATVDGPLDLYGGGHGLASLHLRYDPVDKVFFAGEVHQVSDKHYLVASISPIDKVFKQYNFEGFDRTTPGFQVQTSLQESAFQHDFSQPLSASAYANLIMTASLPRSYVQWQSHSYYDSLLNQPLPGVNGLLYYGDPSHNWVPDHPDDVTITWHGYQNRIGKSPFYFTLRSAEGFAHDGLDPLQEFGDVPYKTIYNTTLGLNLALPSYKLLKDYSGHGRDVFLNASFDKQRESFSLIGHHTDTTITTFSLSRQFQPHLVGLVNYTITNIGDFYGGRCLSGTSPTTGADILLPCQDVAYGLNTVYTNPITGAPVPQWSAFRGFGTTRSLVEQLVFTPTTYVAANLSFRQNHDFPIPLAAYTYENNIGIEPYQATLDLRFRVAPTINLDISRSYYFNFGGIDRWSPQFFITVLQ